MPPSVANANGRFPAANQIVAHPSNPNTILLRTTFGLLFSKDRGATWDWLCERALGFVGSYDIPVCMFADGAVAAGLTDGLRIGTGDGCEWTTIGAGLEKQFIADVSTRRDDPRSGVALTSVNTGASNGVYSYRSQIFATQDSGRTWSLFEKAIDPTVLVETLDVAPTDGARLYVSGSRGFANASQGVLFVSTDGGASWTERPIPLETGKERAPFIAAIDPSDRDRVYVRTSGGSRGRLLVTDDAGVSWRTVFAGGPLLGFALSEDGRTIYIGNRDEGLLVASRSDLVFSKRSPIRIECLMMEGATLFACSDEASGFLVGSSEDGGATFTPKLHLQTVRGPLACPSTATAFMCAADWPAMRDNLGIAASAKPPAVRPEPSPATAAQDGCRCRAAGVSRSSEGALLFAMAAAALVARRRGVRLSQPEKAE